MRAIWSGSLCFGLVNIPVKLFSAVEERPLSFHLFHAKDKGEIHYERVCDKCNDVVDWADVIKGYEISEKKRIFLDEKDFESANVQKTNSIDIQEFVNPEEIDPIFYDKPYYLGPDSKTYKPYFLLADALGQTKKVGIAKYVLKNHEHIGAVRVLGSYLVLNQLRYLNEIRSISNLQIPAPTQKSAKELNIAVRLIQELTSKFNPKEYKDSYTEDLKSFIKQKARGKKTIKKGKKPQKTKESELEKTLLASLKKKKGVA